MIQKKTIKEISELWKEDKKQYVKQSTFAAYVLILENHIYPTFGKMYELEENKVQEFTLQKINNGLRKAGREADFSVRLFYLMLFIGPSIFPSAVK